MSTYVQNVASEPQSPADAAMAEVQRLGRMIANVNDYAAICESPSVNRQDQATELRTHAAELERQQRTILNLLAAGNYPTRSVVEDHTDADNGQPGDEAPLVMRSVFGDDYAPTNYAPAMNTVHADEGDESPLPIRSVFDADYSGAATPAANTDAEDVLVMPRMTF